MFIGCGSLRGKLWKVGRSFFRLWSGFTWLGDECHKRVFKNEPIMTQLHPFNASRTQESLDMHTTEPGPLLCLASGKEDTITTDLLRHRPSPTICCIYN